MSYYSEQYYLGEKICKYKITVYFGVEMKLSGILVQGKNLNYWDELAKKGPFYKLRILGINKEYTFYMALMAHIMLDSLIVVREV